MEILYKGGDDDDDDDDDINLSFFLYCNGSFLQNHYFHLWNAGVPWGTIWQTVLQNDIIFPSSGEKCFFFNLCTELMASHYI